MVWMVSRQCGVVVTDSEQGVVERGEGCGPGRVVWGRIVNQQIPASIHFIVKIVRY